MTVLISRGWRWVAACAVLGMVGGACNQGQPAVSSIAIHPTKPRLVYIGTTKRIYKSRDGGDSWEIADHGMSSARVMSLAVDPNIAAQVYAGTFGDAIWRSWNGGQEWIPDNRGLKEHISIVTAIVFDREIPTTMYLGSTVGVYKRTDPDGFWLERVNGMLSVYVVDLVEDPKHPGTLYAGTSGGVYKSTNRAEHWTPMNQGLDIDEVGGALSHGVNSIVIHPGNTEELFIGTTRGLYQSLDGGMHWAMNDSMPSGNVTAVVINPKNPSILYAGSKRGIHKSVDGGKQWTAVDTGLTNLAVRVIALHPDDPEIIFAGTNSGLFKSVDGGQTWELKLMPR